MTDQFVAERVAAAPVIEARDLLKSFGATPALRGASLAIAPGEIVAVMGPSGSGKSTLLHCLAGILVPDTGEVWCEGRRIDTLSERERSALRRDSFGFVFQTGQLVPELTAEENVALPLLLTLTRRSAALVEARGWFERLDLVGLENRRSSELSGGQAQRVALARALVNHPRILFADEPTGSLDSLNGEHVMELLVAASHEQHTSVVIVTHDARVAAYTQREIVVRDGKVAGPVDHRVPGMTRLGLRLTLASGREGVIRLVAIAAAVGIGVALLLTTLAGIHAVHAQAARTAWLTTSKHNGRPSVDEATVDPLWAEAGFDQYGASEIERVDLAPTGPRSPVPPGISHLPGPGQYYASPALARLLASTPRSQLGDRYPGRLVGTIGSEALASPRSFVIIIGHTAEELSQAGAAQIRSFETAAQGAPGDRHPDRMQLILAVVAGALLIPVLLFIAAASRLAAARREQRFAAMRLVGATPHQVSVVAAVEASVAAVLGVVAGFVLFFALRPLLATVPFTGEPFFHNDLSLHSRDVLLVAIGVPIAAVAAARLSLRRVQISPLGVTRQAAPPDPTAWRVIPLVAGIAELAYFVGRRLQTLAVKIRAYGAGFLLAMIGLLIAGPWVTMIGSRLMVRRARRPSTLIAGRRLAANPRSAFRAVSGLIVALFVSSAALGIITTILAYHSTSTGGAAGRNVLVEDLGRYDSSDGGPPVPTGTAMPSDLLGKLNAVPGVRGVAAIHVNPSMAVPEFGGPPPGLVACAELAPIPTLGRCAPGATVAAVPVTLGSGGVASVRTNAARGVHTWPAAATTAEELAGLPVTAVDVNTDGSTAAVEGARTVLEVVFPNDGAPSTIGDISAANAQLIAGWRQLAEVAIIASLVIAACSLAVSVAASLIDRKRPFSLLRLTGTPLSVLDRVVGIEAGLPLILVAVAAGATGLLAAHLFLRAQLNESLQPPGASYYLAVAAGVAFALGIIAATLPLLRRITGPETARNE